MARLCTQVCSLLNERALENMRSRKIFTFEDFLREDPEKLVKICQLPYTEIMVIRRNLISHYSAFPKNGLDAYNELLIHSAIIPSGVLSLDGMLDGGFVTGSLTEFYGVPSSGKTQLCFTMAANVALKFKQHVHYIDAKGDFSGKRFHQILTHHSSNSEEIEEALKNVKVTSVRNIYQLLSFLHHLKVNLNHDTGNGTCTRLIIIDSLPPLYYRTIGKEYSDGLGLLNHLAATLKNIAVDNRIAFIIVNLATKEFGEDTLNAQAESPFLKPALGNYWLHVPNLRLLFLNNDNDEEIDLFISKSCNHQIGRNCKVHVTESGVQ